MMATYHQSAIPMDDFINSIPRDALAEALLFALEENKARTLYIKLPNREYDK